MATTPVGTAEDHFGNLRVLTARYFPEALTCTFGFFLETEGYRLGDCELLPGDSLLGVATFTQLFNRFVSEGCGWINLGGEGFLPDGTYAVAVQTSESRGLAATLVELRGPCLEPDDVPRESARVFVGLVEELARMLRHRGYGPLGEDLLGGFGCRKRGEWLYDPLRTWTGEEFQQLEGCLRDLIARKRQRLTVDASKYELGSLKNLDRLLNFIIKNSRASEEI